MRIILVLSALAFSLSPVSAQPPLRLRLDWPVVALGIGLYALVGAALVAIATRRAFRADVAGRFAEAGT